MAIVCFSVAAGSALSDMDMEFCGFEVVGKSSDASMGIRMLSEKQPDVALVSSRLVGMTGVELMKRVRLLGVTGKFIMVSESEDFEAAREAYRNGADDFFVLPAEISDLSLCLRRLSEKDDGSQQVNDELDPRFRMMLDYIDAHSFEKLRLDDISEMVGFNKNYICHLFKKQLGMTFIDYVTRNRMKEACLLLETTFLNVETVAKRCGYDDAAYFNRVFRKYMNMTPIMYRKSAMGS